MKDELKHYRTPGSINGIRNYQFENGTWTELGKARRREEYRTAGGDRESNSKSVILKKKIPPKAEIKKNTGSESANRVTNQKVSNSITDATEKGVSKEIIIDSFKERALESKNPKLIYENRDLFTTQELNDFANRLSAEKRIKDLYYSPSAANKAKSFVVGFGKDLASTAFKNGAKYLLKSGLNNIGSDDTRIGDILFGGNQQKKKDN